jgi:hypothetical protein
VGTTRRRPRLRRGVVAVRLRASNRPGDVPALARVARGRAARPRAASARRRARGSSWPKAASTSSTARSRSPTGARSRGSRSPPTT